jgi:hypothetical protein
MSNPNSALYWLMGLVCCQGPIWITLTALVFTAFHRGWFNFHVDRSRAPRLGKRND